MAEEKYEYPPWIENSAPLPEHTSKYKISQDTFEQSIPGRAKRIEQIQKSIRNKVPAITDAKSWMCTITPEKITYGTIEDIHLNVTSRAPVLRAVYLILKTSQKRLYHLRGEIDSFLGWGGQGWIPYCNKQGPLSLMQLVHALSEGM